MQTNRFEKITEQQYVEISSTTGSIFVEDGQVSVTIQTSQPSPTAPIMDIIQKGESKPLKVSAGYKLYAKSHEYDYKPSTITYTEV